MSHDTIEAQAQEHIVAAQSHIHDAVTLLLRTQRAGQLRCISEDLAAHRNAILRLSDAISRHVAATLNAVDRRGY